MTRVECKRPLVGDPPRSKVHRLPFNTCAVPGGTGGAPRAFADFIQPADGSLREKD